MIDLYLKKIQHTLLIFLLSKVKNINDKVVSIEFNIDEIIKLLELKDFQKDIIFLRKLSLSIIEHKITLDINGDTTTMNIFVSSLHNDKGDYIVILNNQLKKYIDILINKIGE